MESVIEKEKDVVFEFGIAIDIKNYNRMMIQSRLRNLGFTFENLISSVTQQPDQRILDLIDKVIDLKTNGIKYQKKVARFYYENYNLPTNNKFDNDEFDEFNCDAECDMDTCLGIHKFSENENDIC